MVDNCCAYERHHRLFGWIAMNANYIVRGIEILQKYSGYDGGVDADHDVIYTGGEKVPPWTLKSEDVDFLNRLGWYWDSTEKTWRFFT